MLVKICFLLIEWLLTSVAFVQRNKDDQLFYSSKKKIILGKKPKAFDIAMKFLKRLEILIGTSLTFLNLIPSTPCKGKTENQTMRY